MEHREIGFLPPTPTPSHRKSHASSRWTFLKIQTSSLWQLPLSGTSLHAHNAGRTATVYEKERCGRLPRGELSDQKQQPLGRKTKEKRKPLASRGARPEPSLSSSARLGPHLPTEATESRATQASLRRNFSRSIGSQGLDIASMESDGRPGGGEAFRCWDPGRGRGGRAWLTWDKGQGLLVAFISGAGFRPTLLSCWDRTENDQRSVLCLVRFGTKKATGRDESRPRSRPRSSIDALSREPVHCSPDVTGAEKVTGRMFARD
jgi:hypothetical protein